MKHEILKLFHLMIIFFRGFFTLKNKIFLFSIPTHPNLGDQAQLMCTEKWIRDNFPNYLLIEMEHLCLPLDNGNPKALIFNTKLFQYIVLKLIIRKNDVFIGHSGYFFVDHHGGWFSYDFLLQHWDNRFVILPQTVNFYSPVVKQRASCIFGNKKNLTLLCRDEVSYQKAKEMFGSTKLLLYPDIVTSLIGTRTYNNPRNGVLFCMRDDIEAFYKPSEIDSLMKRFGNIRMEKIDTTLKISSKMMKDNRDKLINDMIEKISTYQVVITDRYHGTIFSAIANTPVVVISSADHKLSSGVNWFPKEVYGDNVQFAKDLEDAYEKALSILAKKSLKKNPPYLKENYWDKLANRL